MDNKKLLDLILKTFPENKDITLAVERENYMYLHYELLCEKQKALNIDTKTVSLLLKRLHGGSNLELKIDLKKLEDIINKKIQILEVVGEFEKFYLKEDEDYWF